MALIKDGALVVDEYAHVDDDADIPGDGPVLVSFDQWQAHRERLIRRGPDVGVRLHSDQSPELIAEDLDHLALVALEFPKFRDGRAYSYARILRERYGFVGEVRAVGEVLMEQLHFMLRTGFDAFEIAGDDALEQFRTAMQDFSVWYQPTGDGRPTAMQLRHAPARR
jgi:uncharacterized protein (DUF934 family)